MKVSIQAVLGGDTTRLMDHLTKIHNRLSDQYGTLVDLKVCFEGDMMASGLPASFVTAVPMFSCSTLRASWSPAVDGAPRRTGSGKLEFSSYQRSKKPGAGHRTLGCTLLGPFGMARFLVLKFSHNGFEGGNHRLEPSNLTLRRIRPHSSEWPLCDLDLAGF